MSFHVAVKRQWLDVSTTKVSFVTDKDLRGRNVLATIVSTATRKLINSQVHTTP